MSEAQPAAPSAAPTPAATQDDATPPITGLSDLPPIENLPSVPDASLDDWDGGRPSPIAPPFDPGLQGMGPQLGGLGGLGGGLGGPQLPLPGGDPLAGGGLPLGGAPSVVDPGIPTGIPGDGFATANGADQLRRNAEQSASALLRTPQPQGGFAAPIRLQRNEARLQWQIEQLKRAKQRQDQDR